MQESNTMPQEQEKEQESLLIIGAGVFGVSTAFHLSQSQARHSRSIKIFDRGPFPNPKAATFDINKVVRVGYDSLPYCRLASRTFKAWRTHPLFKQWFHPCGMLFLLPHRGGAAQSIANLTEMGYAEGAEILIPGQVRERFEGVFRDGNFGTAEEVLWDPNVGWMDAEAALEGIWKAAVGNGVEYISCPVSRLLIEDGVCRGVETADGTQYKGHKVLLCAGAETTKILADSAQLQRELHVGNRFVAAAIVVAKVLLTEEQKRRYKSMPAVLWDEEPVKGEVMPLTDDGYLKFIRDIPIKNTVYRKSSESWISIPPSSKESTEWTDPSNLPQKLQDEMTSVISGIFGAEEARHLQPDKLRLCWEPLAPDENWFVTPHPRCEGLYVATAGMGHGWKFLPVIGELIVEMMFEPEKFKLNEMAKMWDWDRELVDSPDEDVIPKRELVDVM